MQYGQGQYGVEQYGASSDLTGPEFRNQSPAPGAVRVAADTTVYAEVYDAGGALDADSVRLYINGALAWIGDRPAPGFSGTRSRATLGHSYLITLPALFEPGLQTVRGTATDTASNAMDESYTFTTVRQLVTDEDIAELLEQDTGIDLYLDTAHDIEVQDLDLRLVVGADEVAQHILVGLKLFLGEWYLDDQAGMPYYRDVFVNAPNTRVIETVFRQEILGDPDIDRLSEFSMELDRATRHLGVDFKAVSTIGDVEVSAVFP